ncbi:alpha/beta hydrolase [Nocardia alni]|uniref:alpha/beta hydrolase n=1 Tax=Nocardia alni TaxID=2815723 RepID=UPI001C24D9B2|nr:alpha/beta hydrolase [Nocardia alni]
MGVNEAGVHDWRTLLDPELVAAAAAAPVVDLSDPVRFRENSRAGAAVKAATVDLTGIDVVDRTVGPGAVAVRVYRPQQVPTTRLPAVLHLHGGGFVSGGPDSSHARMVELTRLLPAVVVSVDYRLAPEHPYPAPLDDSATALRWLVDAADELGVDPERIAVHGISAGGNLAAALALRMLREDGPRLRAQCLIVPITDDRMDSPSMARNTDAPVWNRGIGVLSWRHYLGGTQPAPVYAAPARATLDELRGLPPAYVAVMGLDPLRDEGVAYAGALADAGVPVELHEFPGTFHASFSMAPDAAVSRRFLAEEEDVLRRAFS